MNKMKNKLPILTKISILFNQKCGRIVPTLLDVLFIKHLEFVTGFEPSISCQVIVNAKFLVVYL